jgi:hypothetical protein
LDYRPLTRNRGRGGRCGLVRVRRTAAGGGGGGAAGADAVGLQLPWLGAGAGVGAAVRLAGGGWSGQAPPRPVQLGARCTVQVQVAWLSTEAGGARGRGGSDGRWLLPGNRYDNNTDLRPALKVSTSAAL